MSAITPQHFESASAIADGILHFPLGPEARRFGEYPRKGDWDIRQLLEEAPDDLVHYDTIDGWREGMMRVYLKSGKPYEGNLIADGKAILTALAEQCDRKALAARTMALHDGAMDSMVNDALETVTAYYETPPMARSAALREAMEKLRHQDGPLLMAALEHYDHTIQAASLREHVIPMLNTLGEAMARESKASQRQP